MNIFSLLLKNKNTIYSSLHSLSESLSIFRGEAEFKLYILHMHMNIVAHVSYMPTCQYRNRVWNCTWLYINMFILQALDYPSSNEC